MSVPGGWTHNFPRLLPTRLAFGLEKAPRGGNRYRCGVRGLSWFSGVPLSVWYLQGDGESQDIYDRYLTQAEIQGHINQVNGKGDTRRAGGGSQGDPPPCKVWGCLSGLTGPTLSRGKVRVKAVCALPFGQQCLKKSLCRGLLFGWRAMERRWGPSRRGRGEWMREGEVRVGGAARSLRTEWLLPVWARTCSGCAEARWEGCVDQAAAVRPQGPRRQRGA